MTLYRVTPKEYDIINEYNMSRMIRCRNVTPESEAPQVVKKILDTHGGLPADAGEIRVWTQYQDYCVPDTPPDSTPHITTSYPELVRVMYERSIDDFPVVGGGFIRIEIGRDGEVISFDKVWRTVTPVKKVQVISSSQALKRILAGEVLNAVPKCDCDVTVTDVKLAYLEEGYNETQEYVEPIWVFSGSGYEYEVPALASPHISGPPSKRVFYDVAE